MPAHLTPCPLGVLCRVMAPQRLSQVVGTTLLYPGSQDGGPA